MRSRFAVLLLVTGVTLACGPREEPAQEHAQEAATAPAAPAVTSAERPKMASADYAVRWDAHTIPGEVQAGDPVRFTVTFTNMGQSRWPDRAAGDPAELSGRYAVRVSHLWSSAETTTEHAETRADIPHSIEPGQTATVTVDAVAPVQPGNYFLKVELVYELVDWFQSHGAETLTIPVRVTAPGS